MSLVGGVAIEEGALTFLHDADYGVGNAIDRIAFPNAIVGGEEGCVDVIADDGDIGSYGGSRSR